MTNGEIFEGVAGDGNGDNIGFRMGNWVGGVAKCDGWIRLVGDGIGDDKRKDGDGPISNTVFSEDVGSDKYFVEVDSLYGKHCSSNKT